VTSENKTSIDQEIAYSSNDFWKKIFQVHKQSVAKFGLAFLTKAGLI
jgi:hypothetical protein